MYELISPEKKSGLDGIPASGASPHPLLSVKNLSCSYTSQRYGLFGKKEIKPVLNGVNMEMSAGEIYGLAGSSGCGKSTLARCILGLIDYEGEISISPHTRPELACEPVSRWMGNVARRRPGKCYILQKKLWPQTQRHGELGVFVPSCEVLAQMVFQDPGASLNPVKKIGWLMEEPLVIHKRCDNTERQRRVDEMLIRVGLGPSYKDRRPDELSGGQKQRVCIGRALILEPRLLIADEAISSLDVSVGAQILNLFRELNKTLGLGILFISHNIDAVEYLCDRVAVFRER